MPERRSKSDRKRKRKYRRARVRHFLFTHGPNRLSGGRLRRRHIGQPVTTRELTVELPGWPSSFDGIRIGHLSDLHVGDLMPVEKALDIIEQLDRQRPDLVVFTGDLVDLHHHDAPPVLDALASVDAPFGCAMVLGNHDELHCPDTLMSMAREAGIMMLHNEAVRIHHDGDPLVVAGIGWAKAGDHCAALVDAVCGDETHLLLAHNPRAFGRAGELGIPLTLSGHTHGGQVALRETSEQRNGRPYRAGLYESNGSRLYVTAGVGAWFPLRVNCPPEIAMIEVTSVG